MTAVEETANALTAVSLNKSKPFGAKRQSTEEEKRKVECFYCYKKKAMYKNTTVRKRRTQKISPQQKITNTQQIWMCLQLKR